MSYMLQMVLTTVYHLILIFLLATLFKIIRVHIYLKNKKENTVSIIKGMRKTKQSELIYGLCILILLTVKLLDKYLHKAM